MDTSIFKYSRNESFTYELLTVIGSSYIHKADITDYVSNGSIDFNFTKDIIGSASFEVNTNVSNIVDINYLSDLVKIWYNLGGYSIPLGVYSLSSPQRKSDGTKVHRTVKGYDLLYRVDQDRTTTASSFPSGTNVIDAVKTLLDSLGGWVQYNIEDSDETLSEDMTYQLGRSKLYIINGLLNAVNYYPLWASGNGVFRAIPWTNTQTITWNFYDNSESLYKKDITAVTDYTNVYNKVIVVTNETEADTEPLYKILTFEDLGIENDVPFSYTNIGYYKTEKFSSEAVSQDYVDLRAERELLKMLEIEESITKEHAFVTSRELDGLPYQGDCYNFRNSLLDLDATYKIESMKWNLNTGSMVNSTIRRVRSVTE